MDYSRQDLIDHINKSPEAVAVHNKEEWLDIFGQYAIVEDPVGSAPHVAGLYDGKENNRGNSPIARFYESFIAPNYITFDVAQDIVCGKHVVRDLTVHIKMSDKVEVQTPMHLLYELSDVSGEWKIMRLAAHWELIPMLGRLFSKGLAALPIMSALSMRMMRNQGLMGAIGFMRGVTLLGAEGKEIVEQFETVFSDNDKTALAKLFAEKAKVEMPYGTASVNVSELSDLMPGKIKFTKVLKCAYTVSCSFEYEHDGSSKKGVMIFEFNVKTKQINRLVFYYE